LIRLMDTRTRKIGKHGLGFVTTVQLTAKLFSNQPTKLYLINTG
jgi:hypothetical protein